MRRLFAHTPSGEVAPGKLDRVRAGAIHTQWPCHVLASVRHRKDGTRRNVGRRLRAQGLWRGGPAGCGRLRPAESDDRQHHGALRRHRRTRRRHAARRVRCFPDGRGEVSRQGDHFERTYEPRTLSCVAKSRYKNDVYGEIMSFLVREQKTGGVSIVGYLDRRARAASHVSWDLTMSVALWLRRIPLRRRGRARQGGGAARVASVSFIGDRSAENPLIGRDARDRIMPRGDELRRKHLPRFEQVSRIEGRQATSHAREWRGSEGKPI